MTISKKFFLHNILKKNNIFFNPKKVKDICIDNIANILSAKKNSITFLSKINYVKYLSKCNASAIIVLEGLEKYIPKNMIIISSKNPDLDFIKILTFFNPDSYYTKNNKFHIKKNEIKKKYKYLNFGNNFYLENNVKIGNNVFVGNNVTLKKNCVIGNNVVIGSNVVIENAIISDDVHICDNVVIGKKGFGFKFFNNKCYRIPHIGKVVIKKGCEIGSQCVIDRGSIQDTIIGENTFLDNFVHIAHNVVVGNNCIFAAQVGIAGSTKIGNNVIIGGQAGISGHLTIGNNVRIGGKSGVLKNIKDNETIMGYPANSLREFIKKNK